MEKLRHQEPPVSTPNSDFFQSVRLASPEVLTSEAPRFAEWRSREDHRPDTEALALLNREVVYRVIWGFYMLTLGASMLGVSQREAESIRALPLATLGFRDGFLLFEGDHTTFSLTRDAITVPNKLSALGFEVDRAWNGKRPAARLQFREGEDLYEFGFDIKPSASELETSFRHWEKAGGQALGVSVYPPISPTRSAILRLNRNSLLAFGYAFLGCSFLAIGGLGGFTRDDLGHIRYRDSSNVLWFSCAIFAGIIVLGAIFPSLRTRRQIRALKVELDRQARGV